MVNGILATMAQQLAVRTQVYAAAGNIPLEAAARAQRPLTPYERKLGQTVAQSV